jgi:phosphoribosylaminoimidazole carboxylase (NCAIR synthetase)
MRNGGKAVLAVRNLYVRIKIRVATFDTNHSVTDSTQTIAISVQKFRDYVVKSVRRAYPGQGRCVRRNGQVVDQFELSRFFKRNVLRKKCLYLILYFTCCGQLGVPEQAL